MIFYWLANGIKDGLNEVFIRVAISMLLQMLFALVMRWVEEHDARRV